MTSEIVTTIHVDGIEFVPMQDFQRVARERDEAVADAQMVRADAQRKVDFAKRQRRTMLEALKRERDAYRAAQEDA